MNSNDDLKGDSTTKGSFCDYLTIETNEDFTIEYVDCYEEFRWEVVKNKKQKVKKEKNVRNILWIVIGIGVCLSILNTSITWFMKKHKNI